MWRPGSKRATMSAPDAPATQQNAVRGVEPPGPAEVQAGGGALGSGEYPSLDKARASELGKTVGVQIHKKWAPLFVPQIFAPGATNNKVQCQWLPKYPSKKLAALAYDIANVWRLVHGIAGVTQENARFNFPNAGYHEDSKLKARLLGCQTFKELRGIIKFQLLPRTQQAQPAASPSKLHTAKPAKPQGIKPGCIRIILTPARLRDCRAYLKTAALREAFSMSGETDEVLMQQIKHLKAYVANATSKQHQVFLLPFGLPGRDGLPFLAANLRAMLDAMDAQPGDVLEFEYKAQADGVVQVAASLLRSSVQSFSGVALPGLPPLPAVDLVLPSSSASLGHAGTAEQLGRGTALEQALGAQRGSGAEAEAGVEGAAEAALLLGMRRSQEVPAVTAAGVQAWRDGQQFGQAAAAPGDASHTSAPGAAAATSVSPARPAVRKRIRDGDTGSSDGGSEHAAKRQVAGARDGGTAVGAQPPAQRQQELPEPQALSPPLAQLPPQPSVLQAAAPGNAPPAVEASRSSPGLPPGPAGAMQAARPVGGGAGPGGSTGMAAAAADVVQQALALLAAAREADEQKRPGQQMQAVIKVLRLFGVERSLRTAYTDFYGQLSLEKQSWQVQLFHVTLLTGGGAEEVVRVVRRTTGPGVS